MTANTSDVTNSTSGQRSPQPLLLLARSAQSLPSCTFPAAFLNHQHETNNHGLDISALKCQQIPGGGLLKYRNGLQGIYKEVEKLEEQICLTVKNTDRDKEEYFLYLSWLVQFIKDCDMAAC